MSDVIKVPILGVSREVEEYERNVISYLKNSLLHSNSDIELEDISFYDSTSKSLEEVVTIVEKFDGKVILLTDAKVGNSSEYEAVAKKFYEMDFRPFVLVTHIEDARFDPGEVSMLPTYLVEYFDRSAEWYNYLYRSLFFNYDTKCFMSSYDGEKEDSSIFVKAIREYVGVE